MEGTMKDKLLKTAQKLTPPQTQYLQEFSNKCDMIAEKGSIQLAGRKDLDKLIGENNFSMAEDNNRNFARFMDALFTEYSPEVFVDTVLWVFRAYRSHGFQTTYWAANLNIWVDILKEELSKKAFEQIYPFYNWLIINIPTFTNLTDCDVPDIPADIQH